MKTASQVTNLRKYTAFCFKNQKLVIAVEFETTNICGYVHSTKIVAPEKLTTKKVKGFIGDRCNTLIYSMQKFGKVSVLPGAYDGRNFEETTAKFS